MLAVDAHLVRTECGLAPVTGAPHAHADRLGDSRELEIGGRLPLAGFEGQAVFGEEGARPFLLHDAVVGEHNRFGAGRLAGWGCGRSTVQIVSESNPSSKVEHLAYVVWLGPATSERVATDWRLVPERGRRAVFMRLRYLDKPSGLSSTGRLGVSCEDMARISEVGRQILGRRSVSIYFERSLYCIGVGNIRCGRIDLGAVASECSEPADDPAGRAVDPEEYGCVGGW